MSASEKRSSTPGHGAPQRGAPKSKGARNANADGEDGTPQPVSMPKQGARSAAATHRINFGTVDDQSAAMSSSPVAQPTAGKHLQDGNPTVFGTVAADPAAAVKKGPKKHLDFQKLFQGHGGSSVKAPVDPAVASTQSPVQGMNAGKLQTQRGPAQSAVPGQPMLRPDGQGMPPGVPFGVPPAGPYPMYPHVGYPVSPGAFPYMARPQQSWSPVQGNSPHLPHMGPPKDGMSPHSSMVPPPGAGGAAALYPGAPASNFTMNAGARMFEPQKSRALRIVNPETQAEVNLDQVRQQAQGASQPGTNTNSTTPSLAPTTTSSQPGTPKSTHSVASSTSSIVENRVKTQTDFQQKVLRLKAEREKTEIEKSEKEQAEKEKEKEAEKAATEKAAAEKAAAEKAAADKAAAEKAAAEKAAADKAAAEKAAAEKAAADKAAEKAAAEKAAADKAAEKAAAEKAAADKAAEKAAADKAAEKATAEQAAADKAAEKATAEKAAADKAAEKAAAEKAAEKATENTAAENTAAENTTAGHTATENAAAEKAATSQAAQATEATELAESTDFSPALDATSDTEPSGSAQALQAAKPIDNLESVTYPPAVQAPQADLNKNAPPGKYRYDRDFLLQFMSVYTEKPTELPLLATIGMESVSGRGGRRTGPSRGGTGGRGGGRTSEERFAASGRGAYGSGPMGAFGSGSRGQSLSRGGSSGTLPSRETMGTGVPMGGRTKSNRGRQRGPHVNPPEKGGPTIPLDQVTPLAYSENRWRTKGAEEKGGDPMEVVQRKVKSLLNKLTIEKFDSISSQIVDFANRSIDEHDGKTLRQVIALVFEKAIDESAWSEMYAQLCAKIQVNLDPEIKDEILDEKEQKEYRGGFLFRKYLLTWCQGDFEKGWGAAKDKPTKEVELLSDEYYEEQKAKRHALGLVQFVGELFKLQMLQPRIMHTCIVRLLRTTTEPEEDEIESVCRLLATVGYLLDSTSGNHKSRMDVYFKRIDDILASPTISSRMRFMLLDVIDLRSNNWVPRHDTTAPKTIAEIHADAAKQQQRKETEKFSRHDNPISRGGSRRGQQREREPTGSDGWSTVGGQAQPARSSRAGDLSEFGKGIDRSSGKLGSGPQSIFSRKSQGKGSDSGTESPTQSKTNMFDLLNSGEADAPQRKPLQLQPRTKPAEDAGLSEEDAKRKIGNDVKEYLAIRDVGEGVQSIESLPSEHRAAFVDALVSAVLDKKEEHVTDAGRLLAALSERQIISEAALVEGFKPQLVYLDDTSMDAPSAYSFMAHLLVDAGIPRAQIEKLGESMEGEGITLPKDRLLAMVDKLGDS
ncbi:hypothetical protein MVES1_000199 [Malassezia vespertilionis]|uniref:MI domain-containing protein n=1 Tax=Malassezia vespertilionis TaxID=2020962 RepID=A0A2N1JH46_9BASI|nr:uncharacterized protein MVES1_000199 [Malassezia vespertilionis]PKI85858.1 hypothetical protein MVES_000191 [Malassezia vespertilionis]WFD04875.1 hypothetical protein MVES1_000199 [Malassezia vespertilionis]